MIGQQIKSLPNHIIREMVKIALEEDIASGDITAKIIPKHQSNTATIITREEACICGIEWVKEVFYVLEEIGEGNIQIEWHVQEGDKVASNTSLCTLKGNTRALLTGERTALNFLQTLSGVATNAWKASSYLNNGITKILDTRKTIPGLRLAQKYAVACGGGFNHRLGLYDAFLIKENHIKAAGSISKAVEIARSIEKQAEVEVEVENLEELEQAIRAGADIVMLDNFSFEDIQKAIAYNQEQLSPAKIEVSGNIEIENLNNLSSLGIDFISSGALTKHIKAIDLSMRIIE